MGDQRRVAAYSWTGALKQLYLKALASRNQRTEHALRSRVLHYASRSLPLRLPSPRLRRDDAGFHVTTAEKVGAGRVTQPTCGARNESGGRCKNKAIIGSEQCAKHQGRWTPRGQVEQQKKEAAAKLRKLRKKQ